MSHCAQPRIAPVIAVSAPIEPTSTRASLKAFHNSTRRRIKYIASSDHRRGVDQRRDRGRAFHRVGRPVCSGTCALAAAAPMNSASAPRTARRTNFRSVPEHLAVTDRADLGNDHEHRIQDADVADNIMTKALRDASTADALEVVADQQVGREAYEAPADQQPKRLSESTSEHREDEEIQIRGRRTERRPRRAT